MNAPDIMSSDYESNPWPLLNEIRENHPITFHDGLNSWLLSRFEDVEKVLRSPTFTTENYGWQLEPVHGPTILQLEGTRHRLTRGILTPTLRGPSMRDTFEQVITQNSQRLIDGWQRDGHVDLVKQFTQKLPLSVILDVLG